MQIQKLLEKAINSPQNLRFTEAIKLAGAFGFKLDRIRGSHHILKRSGIPELLNFQNVGGKLKPYQIKQMLEIVESYDLTLE
ncbi:MAG TPA: type II toxin-antitoxin system HicA family toxin [Verrucomicrobiae bacterium]|jgi:predicted RNA binding protein YcfA (HicA-like mRNA interferase family)